MKSIFGKDYGVPYLMAKSAFEASIIQECALLSLE
jgi:hypothetical protein